MGHFFCRGSVSIFAAVDGDPYNFCCLSCGDLLNNDGYIADWAALLLTTYLSPILELPALLVLSWFWDLGSPQL